MWVSYLELPSPLGHRGFWLRIVSVGSVRLSKREIPDNRLRRSSPRPCVFVEGLRFGFCVLGVSGPVRGIFFGSALDFQVASFLLVVFRFDETEIVNVFDLPATVLA
jgi:hypothetical protein